MSDASANDAKFPNEAISEGDQALVITNDNDNAIALISIPVGSSREDDEVVVQSVGVQASGVHHSSLNANGKDYSNKKRNSYILTIEKYKFSFLGLIFLMVIGIGYYGVGLFGVLSNGGFSPPSSESSNADRYYGNRFVSPDPPVFIVASHPTWSVDSPQFREAYFQFLDALKKATPGIFGLISYYESPFVGSKTLVSLDGHKVLTSMRIGADVDDGPNSPVSVKAFQTFTTGNPLSFGFAGPLFSSQEITSSLQKDLLTLETGAAPVLLVVLVFAMESLAGLAIPLALVLWSIIWSLAALRLVTLGFNVSNYVTNVTTVFGAGLALDYTLFFHLRYTEELAKHKGEPNYTHADALITTVSTTGRTIIFSACLLISALAGALQFHEYYLSTMSLAILFPVAFAASGAFFVLPTLYLCLEDRIFTFSTKPIVHYISVKCSPCVDMIAAALSFAGRASSAVTNKHVIPALSEDQSKAQYEMVTLKSHHEDEEANSSHLVKTQKPTDLEAAAAIDTTSTVAPDVEGPTASEEGEGIWFRSIMFVMDHPLAFSVSIVACLAALATVFITQINFGVNLSIYLPLNGIVRHTVDTLANEFNGGGRHSTLNIFMQANNQHAVHDPLFLTALDQLTNTLTGLPHVKGVQSITNFYDNQNVTLHEYIAMYRNPSDPLVLNYTAPLEDPLFLTDFDTITSITLTIDVKSCDPAAPSIVRSVRSATNAFADGRLLAWGVTGDAARVYDTNSDVGATMPNFLAVLGVSMLVFVFLLTGSVIMPIKAIVTALLSLCSSFGFLMLVFMQNNGSTLLNFYNSTGALDPLQLIFIFVVAFGLSLDYEVFMLGRIQEIYESTGDNRYAVAKGIQTSARAVTMAAVLLCIAVGGFLGASVMLLQMIGMGIGLSVVMDATIVRCVLVPAVMALLGEWTWWSPEFMRPLVKYFKLTH